MRNLISLSLLILFSSDLFAFSKMYSYQVKHQNPSQLVASMQPHLEATTKITINNRTLLISASESEYRKIEQMLSMLDKALKEYLVEVKILNRRLDDWEMRDSASGAGKVAINAKKVTRYQTGSSKDNNKQFRLKLMESYRGFVETGETFQQQDIVQHYGKFVPKTTNKVIKSGFYLSVNEAEQNQVKVNVSASSETRPSQYQSNTQSSKTSSQFTANKNQWILIATINAGEKSNNRNHSTSSSKSNKRFYYLKVSDY